MLHLTLNNVVQATRLTILSSLAKNQYAISLAVAGFSEQEIDVQVEKGVLTIRGKKDQQSKEGQYLHRGIANRSFERKFNLADHFEVVNAEMNNGLLTVSLQKEIPEAMKPRKITVNATANVNAIPAAALDSQTEAA